MHFKLLVFLIYPFLSFLTSLPKWYQKNNKIIIILFASFVGYTMILSGDLERYSVTYTEYNRNLKEYFANLSNFRVGKPIVDFYDTLLTELNISYHVQFALSFFYFCYLTISNATLLLKSFAIDKLKGVVFFFFSFILLTLFPLKLYSNMAFYLGGAFYINCILNFIILQKSRYFYFSLIAPLFHIGLFPIILVSLGVRYIKGFFTTFLIVILSFIYSSLGLEILQNYGESGAFKGTTLDVKYNAYGSDYAIESFKEHYSNRKLSYNLKFTILTIIEESIINILLPISVLLIFFINKSKLIKQNRIQLNVLKFGFLLFSISNFLIDISQGARFKMFPLYIVLFIFLFYFKDLKNPLFRFVFFSYSIVLFLYSSMWLVAFYGTSISSNVFFLNYPIQFLLNILDTK